MPRNSNGVYTLPAGNPVVSGEVISTSWANPTMSDVAAEITNSLDRNGRGGMLAPFKNADGTQSTPGMTWGNEPTTGFFRNASQDMRAVVGGQFRQRWDANGTQVWNGAAWSEILSVASLPAQLTGYAQKAVNETITGEWTFTPTQTFNGATLFNQHAYHQAYQSFNSDSVAYGILFRSVAGATRWTFSRNPSTDALAIGRHDAAGVYIDSPLSISSTGLLTYTGASSFVGNVNVTGTLTASATVAGASLLAGSATYSGEPRTRYANNVATAGVDVLLSADGGSFGAYRRDTPGWVWQYTLATQAHVFSGSLNATGGLLSNGAAVVPSTRLIEGQFSIQGGGDLSANRGLYLAGDVATPGSSWYYGTDAAGAKGWFPLSGVVGVPEAPVDGSAYARQNASWVSIGTGGVYVLKTGDTMSGPLVISSFANAGALQLSSARPSVSWVDTDQPVDGKAWQIVVNGNVMQFYAYDDAFTTAKSFLSANRSGTTFTNVSLGNNTDYPTIVGYGSGSFGKGFGRQPTTTSDKTFEVNSDVGRVELTARVGDGTINPRVGLFADATGGLGLNMTYSTGVTRFQFQWAGQEAYSYSNTVFQAIDRFFRVNQTTSSTYGLDFTKNGNRRWLIAMAGDSNSQRFEIDRYDSAGVYLDSVLNISTAGVFNIGITGQFVTSQGILRQFNAADTASAFSVYRDTSVAQGMKIYSDSGGSFLRGISSPTNAKGLYIDCTTDDSHTVPSGGSTNIYFRIRNTQQMVMDGSYIDLRAPLKLLNVLAFWFGSDGTSYQGIGRNSSGRLYYNDQGTPKGGVTHWDSSGLQYGNIQIATATPAATGNPGTMVLVYE